MRTAAVLRVESARPLLACLGFALFVFLCFRTIGLEAPAAAVVAPVDPAAEKVVIVTLSPARVQLATQAAPERDVRPRLAAPKPVAPVTRQAAQASLTPPEKKSTGPGGGDDSPPPPETPLLPEVELPAPPEAPSLPELPLPPLP